MKECIACAEEILGAAVLCKHCGTRQDDPEFSIIATERETKSIQSGASSKKTTLVIGASVGAALLILAGFISTLSAPDSGSQGGITVEEFGCSFGTRAASAIVRSSLDEGVNAFVSVGLYGDGVLVHSAVGYGFVEPGGKALINVSLAPYSFIAGECKIINSGY